MYLRQRPQIQELLHRKIQIGAVPHSAAQYARPGRRGIGRRSCRRKPRAYPISAPPAIVRAHPAALPPASATAASIPRPASVVPQHFHPCACRNAAREAVAIPGTTVLSANSSSAPRRPERPLAGWEPAPRKWPIFRASKARYADRSVGVAGRVPAPRRSSTLSSP